DMRALPDGRILTTFHVQPGLIAAPHTTSDPLGRTGWRRGEMENLPNDGNVSRELEPSWYLTPDGTIVMVFRDQTGSGATLVSESHDNGLCWTRPVLSDFPDSRSKQSAGNLPGGTAFRVNNPRRDRRRYPLVLSLSEDGYRFDRAYTLRTGLEDLPPMQFDGRYKRLGYSYPKSLVHEGHLYVAYATNKERIELTRIPLDRLVKANR
ncbi:MAG: exo-alpha-sialidase, partial [Henriciella sp.]|uniref:exo-alpha-sialidase n=1 Tax=Henriciella sp. TaxID=1968823 RepID=UPI003C794DDF